MAEGDETLDVAQARKGEQRRRRSHVRADKSADREPDRAADHPHRGVRRLT